MSYSFGHILSTNAIYSQSSTKIFWKTLFNKTHIMYFAQRNATWPGAATPRYINISVMAGYLHKWFFWVANVEEPPTGRAKTTERQRWRSTRNRRHERFHAIRSVQSVWDRAAVGGNVGFMRAMHDIWLKQRCYQPRPVNTKDYSRKPG